MMGVSCALIGYVIYLIDPVTRIVDHVSSSFNFYLKRNDSLSAINATLSGILALKFDFWRFSIENCKSIDKR